MKRTVSIGLWVATSAGIIAGKWFGIEVVENLTLALIWLFIVTGLLGVFVPSDEMFNTKPVKWKLLIRFLHFFNIVLLFAAGWFLTGTMLLIAWLAIWIKKETWKQAESEKWT